MKHLTLFHSLILSACCLLSFMASAQNCNNPTADNGQYLHANNVRGFYMASGGSFFDGSDPQYRIDDPLVNADFPIATIFAHGLWMGGIDPAGNLAVSAATYGLSSGQHDYYPGPLTEDGAATNINCTDFDRVWSVYRYQIEAHLADFADNGVIDNPIPAVLGWPARGNPQFESTNGFPLPDHSSGYADFADLNANGIYEPLAGDYPRIGQSEILPDHIIWTVFSTRGNAATETGSTLLLPIEVQLTAWAFNCEDNPLLNYSSFASYKIIHRGMEPIQDFRIALWTDFDLGCYTNDYIGSAPELNTFFVYNQDNEDFCSSVAVVAGENPPVQAVTFMNQPLDNFIYYSNAAGSPAPPPATTDPNTAPEYYNYMNGLFRDGTPVSQGGNGYDPASTDVVNHAFSGDPNDPNAWSELSTLQPSTDRRGIGSVGLSSLEPGQVYTLDVAYSYHREPGANHIENVTAMYEGVSNLNAIYEGNFTNICTQTVTCEDNCIWPGDLNADGIANHEDIIALGFGINTTGPTREGPHNWFPRDGENWAGTQIFGANNKHLDADGDGIVDESDFNKTEDHYNFTNGSYTPVFTPSEGNDLIVIKIPGDEELFNLNPNSNTLIRVRLLTDIPDLKALSFVLEYDKQYIESFIALSSGGAESLAHTQTYGDSTEGRVDFAQYSLPVDSPITSGTLITGSIRVKESFPDPLPSDTTFICFRNVKGYLSDGTEVEIGASKVPVQINDIILVSTQEPEWAAAIRLFPNPVDELLNIGSEAVQIKKLQLFDSQGRLLSSYQKNTQQLNLSGLPTGMYYLRIFSDNQFVVRKFVKQE